MLSAARESIAVSSGSDSGNATLPDGGSAAESSSQNLARLCAYAGMMCFYDDANELQKL